MKIATGQVEMPAFSFRIRGCRQLELGDSTFTVPTLKIFDPVEKDFPKFRATLDPTSAECFSHEFPVRACKPLAPVRHKITSNCTVVLRSSSVSVPSKKSG